MISRQALDALWRRVMQLVGRGRTTRVDDGGNAQVLQIRMGADELRDDTPRIAEYGFTSVPPAGTDAVVLFISGERSGGVVIATNNQTVRMRALGDGEVAIYDDKGRYMLLAAAGITVQGKDSPVAVETTAGVSVDAGGDVDVTAGGSIVGQAQALVSLSAPIIRLAATTALELSGAAVSVSGPTAFSGAVDIAGALRQNGHDLGVDHYHADGTRGDGNTGTVQT
jgi:phage baseplate assembly protein V